MGKRSTTSTKSGKFMNPTDQARKEARRKELKKNKKQRMAVRHAVLKGKDAQKILFDLDEIDDMELNPSKPPPLGEKVLKDKRKKLMETFDRVLKLYEKEEPEYHDEFKDLFEQYKERRARKQLYFDEVKSAERVLIDEIPLPDLPVSAPVAPYDIPLPQPKSILKKAAAQHSQLDDVKQRKPPGPPPGPPPALSDSEEEGETDISDEKRRSIRFQDEVKTELPTDDVSEPVEHKATTPLQAAMLKMAAEKAARSLLSQPEDQDEMGAANNDEEVFAEHGNVTDVLDEPTVPQIEPLLPADLASQGLIRPMIYRGPGGAPVIGLQMTAGAVRPTGLLPPGPPPGLPPAMRMHRLPGDLPPRLMRPPMAMPPPGMRPGMAQSGVLSAPPSIMKPPSNRPGGGPGSSDSHATISAKPIIKHHIGDVTRFMPTALKIKRDGAKKGPGRQSGSSVISAPISSAKTAQKHTGQTKDDAYDDFMKEIEGIM